jgi:hypothetical protein
VRQHHHVDLPPDSADVGQVGAQVVLVSRWWSTVDQGITWCAGRPVFEEQAVTVGSLDDVKS